MDTLLLRLMNVVPAPVARSFHSHAALSRVIRPLVNRLVPRDPVPVTVRSGPAAGLRLLIYPRAEKYYWTGTHEPQVQEALAAVLRPGMVFWDVGAHIGYFSLLASRLVGTTGRVHAFEPMDRNRERLMASVRLNGARNITVHDVGLTAAPGTYRLYSHRSTTMWTLVPERGEGEGLVIECRTLDQMLDVLDTPDLVKIDAEGAELDVLRGGSRLMASARPAVIIELSGDEQLAEARALLPGYGFERLTRRHWLAHAGHPQTERAK